MATITRRDFIRLAGISAAAAGLSSCLGEPLPDFLAQPSVPGITSPSLDHWAPTVCRICPAGCGVLVRVVDGRAVNVQGNPRHPLNQGKVCPRAQATLQVLYDPDRIQHPLRRTSKRGSGRWERIPWEEAIAQVARHLLRMRQQGEAHTLLFLHDAPPGHMHELIVRFCQAYGSPNTVSAEGLDAERLTHLLTQGWFDLAAHNWEETAYVLFFGGSFLEDWVPQVHLLRAYSYMRRGRPDLRARLVQIGPRFSVSAAKVDEWVPLLPGRQGALALGMAHVIIRERLYDQDFVADHSEGFDDFASFVLEGYTPEKVTGLTGVPSETIRRLAREFVGNRPAVAVAGRGLAEGTNTLSSHLAIHALNGLVGSIDVPGGVLRPRQAPFTPWESLPEPSPEPRLDGAGSVAYPLAANAPHSLPERILVGAPYAPRALFLYETNPLFEGAGANRWHDVFQRVPFIVSFSSFLDESTRHADLVLPNHTFPERWVDGTPPGGPGTATIGIGRPVIEPLYDTRHTGDVLLALAQTVGGSMVAHLPWAGYEELLRFRTRGLFEAGGSIQADSFDRFWSELQEQGVWFGAPYAFGQWEQVLTTPSGHFQFHPDYEPTRYSGGGSEFPLHLIPYRVIADAGCRAPNAPLLWEMYGLHIKEMWRNWAELHPETAHQLGIEDGDPVWVESPQGRIRLKARIYEGTLPDAINVPLGGGHTAGGRWASQVGGGNVAELVVPQTDPQAGTVAWCGTRVKVYKG